MLTTQPAAPAPSASVGEAHSLGPEEGLVPEEEPGPEEGFGPEQRLVGPEAWAAGPEQRPVRAHRKRAADCRSERPIPMVAGSPATAQALATEPAAAARIWRCVPYSRQPISDRLSAMACARSAAALSPVRWA